MRIALILLSITALIFIGFLSWSLLDSENPWMATRPVTESSVNGTDVEALRTQIKTEEKLKELETIVRELAKKNGNSTSESTVSIGEKSPEPAVKLSGKFLAKIMPTATLSLMENQGIY